MANDEARRPGFWKFLKNGVPFGGHDLMYRRLNRPRRSKSHVYRIGDRRAWKGGYLHNLLSDE
jgi:hypothetical protein